MNGQPPRSHDSQIGRVPAQRDPAPDAAQVAVVIPQLFAIDQEHQWTFLPLVDGVQGLQVRATCLACGHQGRIGQQCRGVPIERQEAGGIGAVTLYQVFQRTHDPPRLHMRGPRAPGSTCPGPWAPRDIRHKATAAVCPLIGRPPAQTAATTADRPSPRPGTVGYKGHPNPGRNRQASPRPVHRCAETALGWGS